MGKFVSGMSLGMIAGTALGMTVVKQKKKLNKSCLGKTVKSFTHAVENMVDALGL